MCKHFRPSDIPGKLSGSASVSGAACTPVPAIRFSLPQGRVGGPMRCGEPCATIAISNGALSCPCLSPKAAERMIFMNRSNLLTPGTRVPSEAVSHRPTRGCSHLIVGTALLVEALLFVLTRTPEGLFFTVFFGLTGSILLLLWIDDRRGRIWGSRPLRFTFAPRDEVNDSH